jgi:ubiquitin
MKCVISVLALFIVILTGCGKQQKDYPDVKYSQIIKDVKWGAGFNEVKTLLEDKYNLGYKQEKKQSKPNSRVFEFTGGRVEGINTHSWEACFEGDSLVFIMVKVEPSSANEKIFQSFKNGIEKISFAKTSDNENEWIFSENGAARCALQLNKYENGIVMMFSSNKFTNSSQK